MHNHYIMGSTNQIERKVFSLWLDLSNKRWGEGARLSLSSGNDDVEVPQFRAGFVRHPFQQHMEVSFMLLPPWRRRLCFW